MNKLLIFLGFVFLTSCSIEYDGNTRLQLKTKIVKSDGTPLTKTRVTVNVYSSLSTFNTSSDVISTGITDENGDIEILFPSPDSDNYRIEFVFTNEDTSYVQKRIDYVLRTDFVNYKLFLDPIMLYKSDELVNFQLSFNKVNSTSSLNNFNFNGITFNPIEYYNPFEDVYITDDFAMNFVAKKNQIFQVEYSVNNTSTNTNSDYTIQIPISTTNVNYTINY